jgi:regulator of protease activity HflC (stomatin/prohibitin superfamily)
MRQIFKYGAIALSSFIVIFLLCTGWTTVASGQVGVVSTFGKVQEGYLDEGFHLKSPFAKVIPFDAREKTLKVSLGIPTQDQFTTAMDVSIQYRLIKEMAPKMLKETGSPQQVIDVHLEPLVRSLVRELGKTIEKAEDLYQSKIQTRLQTELYTGLVGLSSKGVKIDKLLLRGIKLPDLITQAVARKKQMAQDAEAEKESLKKFMVQQERKEQQALAEKKAETIQAEKKKAVLIIQANGEYESAVIQAKAVLVRAEAEAEAKKKIIDVMGRDGFIKLEAMKELGSLANGNHVIVLDPNAVQPLPFMNLTGK